MILSHLPIAYRPLKMLRTMQRYSDALFRIKCQFQPYDHLNSLRLQVYTFWQRPNCQSLYAVLCTLYLQFVQSIEKQKK